MHHQDDFSRRKSRHLERGLSLPAEADGLPSNCCPAYGMALGTADFRLSPTTRGNPSNIGSLKLFISPGRGVGPLPYALLLPSCWMDASSAATMAGTPAGQAVAAHYCPTSVRRRTLSSIFVAPRASRLSLKKFVTAGSESRLALDIAQHRPGVLRWPVKFKVRAGQCREPPAKAGPPENFGASLVAVDRLPGLSGTRARLRTRLLGSLQSAVRGRHTAQRSDGGCSHRRLPRATRGASEPDPHIRWGLTGPARQAGGGPRKRGKADDCVGELEEHHRPSGRCPAPSGRHLLPLSGVGGTVPREPQPPPSGRIGKQPTESKRAAQPLRPRGAGK